MRVRLATPYHPQTSGQTKNTNRAIKRILERTVNGNRKEWEDKLDDALWAFRTAYKSPIGSNPFKIVYGKACHLPIEMEHKAYWALKNVNLDLDAARKHRYLQLNKLAELRNEAYEHSRAYKERTKRWHDAKIMDKKFHEGEEVFPFGTVEACGKNGISFKVNGHRLKKYYEGDVNAIRETLYFAKKRKEGSHSKEMELEVTSTRIRVVKILFSDFRGYEFAQDMLVESSSLAIIIRKGTKSRALEQEMRDLDVENKHKKNLKARGTRALEQAGF
ncbi:reverse transcriptase domain-containing protein [Tanacetum coccineum]